MGPLATGTAVTIQGPAYWYYMWLSGTPPTDANTEEQTLFKAQCAETNGLILDSFKIPK